MKKNNKIDSVVYFALGKIKNKNIFSLDWEYFQDHISIQAWGLVNLVTSLREYIKEKNKLKIVVVLTKYCFVRLLSSSAHYVRSKYALLGLLKSLSVDLAKYSCMVNTGLLASLPPKLIEIVVEKSLLKRIAKPGDVAALIEFLVGDGSDYLNDGNQMI